VATHPTTQLPLDWWVAAPSMDHTEWTPGTMVLGVPFLFHNAAIDDGSVSGPVVTFEEARDGRVDIRIPARLANSALLVFTNSRQLAVAPIVTPEDVHYQDLLQQVYETAYEPGQSPGWVSLPLFPDSPTLLLLDLGQLTIIRRELIASFACQAVAHLTQAGRMYLGNHLNAYLQDSSMQWP
jgi:hypothetical protein